MVHGTPIGDTCRALLSDSPAGIHVLYGTPNLVFDHDPIFDQQYLWNPKIGFLVEIDTVGRKSDDGRKPD